MSLDNSHQFPVLVGDIGGTNARFQIVEHSDSAPILFDIAKTADFATIEDAILATVLAKTELCPATAILAAAGPISSNGLDLTNCHWNIQPSRFLAAGISKSLILMNDFEAQALSLPFLADEDCHSLGGAHAVANPATTKVVLGPGTGLGVGILVHSQGKWIPVAGEGGHVDIGPRNDREILIWSYLETVENRVSAEQILCGDGLLNLYHACCLAREEPAPLDTPAEISAAALNTSSEPAVEALAIFCSCLGRIAGDLALTTTAHGGVYIAGGIGQKILPFLEKSAFRASFEDKAPHRSLLENMQTLVVTHPLPALVGLVSYAKRPHVFSVDIIHRNWQRD